MTGSVPPYIQKESKMKLSKKLNIISIPLWIFALGFGWFLRPAFINWLSGWYSDLSGWEKPELKFGFTIFSVIVGFAALTLTLCALGLRSEGK